MLAGVGEFNDPAKRATLATKVESRVQKLGFKVNKESAFNDAVEELLKRDALKGMDKWSLPVADEFFDFGLGDEPLLGGQDDEAEGEASANDTGVDDAPNAAPADKKDVSVEDQNQDNQVLKTTPVKKAGPKVVPKKNDATPAEGQNQDTQDQKPTPVKKTGPKVALKKNDATPAEGQKKDTQDQKPTLVKKAGPKVVPKKNDATPKKNSGKGSVTDSPSGGRGEKNSRKKTVGASGNRGARRKLFKDAPVGQGVEGKAKKKTGDELTQSLNPTQLRRKFSRFEYNVRKNSPKAKDDSKTGQMGKHMAPGRLRLAEKFKDQLAGVPLGGKVMPGMRPQEQSQPAVKEVNTKKAEELQKGLEEKINSDKEKKQAAVKSVLARSSIGNNKEPSNDGKADGSAVKSVFAALDEMKLAKMKSSQGAEDSFLEMQKSRMLGNKRRRPTRMGRRARQRTAALAAKQQPKKDENTAS